MVLAERPSVSATNVDEQLRGCLPFDEATPSCLTLAEVETWSTASAPVLRREHVSTCPFCIGLLAAMDRTNLEQQRQFVNQAVLTVETSRRSWPRRSQTIAAATVIIGIGAALLFFFSIHNS